MWAKPSDLYDREHEWDALSRFVSDRRPGSTLAVVRGRRRHGKSVLLRQLCRVAGGFYHQAVEGTTVEQLRDLGRSYARYAQLPAAPAFADWGEAIDALLALPSLPSAGGEPLAIVLDEFPYLTASAPALASTLQRALDAGRDGGLRSRLVLCGSAMTVMGSLLAGQAPLRGRASVEVPVGPFAFRDAADFLGLRPDPQVALKVHALCGGVPGYYADMLGGDLPAGDDDFDRWVVQGPLAVTRPLLHEARHLLDDEPGLRDRAVYLSVLAAIAEGATTSGKIAARLGRAASGVAHPLSTLSDLGLVVRREDPLRPRRPTWHVADPLLRFYAAVLRRDWARLERGRAADVWRDAQPTWRSQVLGPHFEELARTWTAEHGAAATTGGPLRAVGATVVHDAAGRSAHEVDVVGLGTGGSGDRAVVLGEAKYRDEPIGVRELERLRRLRDLLAGRGAADAGAHLLLFGAAGFTDALRAEAAADASRVALVDLPRLYEGE